MINTNSEIVTRKNLLTSSRRLESFIQKANQKVLEIDLLLHLSSWLLPCYNTHYAKETDTRSRYHIDTITMAVCTNSIQRNTIYYSWYSTASCDYRYQKEKHQTRNVVFYLLLQN